MLRKLAMHMDVEGKVKSLPRCLKVGDFFSGAGTFYKIMEAISGAFGTRFPEASKDLEACNELFCYVRTGVKRRVKSQVKSQEVEFRDTSFVMFKIQNSKYKANQQT